ncbi:hypothetical protein [Nocardia africana]|uniref:Uncharacterized protein n=1 Tax=Nocardia africana TaxID=134964 RepID=A0ABW6NTJ7_9NOCA
MDSDAKTVIMFAIRWAPFGGAPAEELMITFGVTRWRFLHMIRQALRPRAGDRKDARTVKRHLLEVVNWSWHAYPDSSSSRLNYQSDTVGTY